MFRLTIIFIAFFFFTHTSFAQTDSSKSKNYFSPPKTKSDYQIYLKQPAKEIKLLMYEKNFLPIQGKLSEDRKSILMRDYEQGNKVRIKVIYEDGTVDEFTKSPCYIDPLVL